MFDCSPYSSAVLLFTNNIRRQDPMKMLWCWTEGPCLFALWLHGSLSLIAIIHELQITIHRQTPLLQLQTPTKSRSATNQIQHNWTAPLCQECSPSPLLVGLWAMYSVHTCAMWSVSNVQCALWSVCNVQCALWSVCNVQCALWSIPMSTIQPSLSAFLCSNASRLYWNYNFVCVNVALHRWKTSCE